MSKRQVHDAILFLSRFLKDPKQVGSLAPSSKALKKEITQHVHYDQEQNILEVGPGTGAFTDDLIARLGPKDQLDLVELDPEFCQRLRDKFGDHKQVYIFEGSILDWKPEYKYDVIVSSLPLNAFQSDIVEEILKCYESLVAENGMISSYEYLGFPEIKKHLGNEDYLKTQNLLKSFMEKYSVEDRKIWANIPPAIVHHCMIDKTI